jgi:hypothetical protein
MNLRNVVALAGILAVTLPGCRSKTQSEVTVPNKGRIYAGMKSDEVKKIMGEPDQVGSGRRGGNYTKHFRGRQMGSDSVEWSWKLPGEVLVVYLEDGVVEEAGFVKP